MSHKSPWSVAGQMDLSQTWADMTRTWFSFPDAGRHDQGLVHLLQHAMAVQQVRQPCQGLQVAEGDVQVARTHGVGSLQDLQQLGSAGLRDVQQPTLAGRALCLVLLQTSLEQRRVHLQNAGVRWQAAVVLLHTGLAVQLGSWAASMDMGMPEAH